ncbi:hypothetical protein Ccrd_013651 [Cynara cardunculus var. scolymus]|uniref:Transmembrane protein n=1 Tax=Cynara cardunculus var. scolymus TaxID=59895 RepID=A0A124SH02_CYNCS|nr:hypothetical protein Ccrd_013651 [Cynara cardunculus var. scolymus]
MRKKLNEQKRKNIGVEGEIRENTMDRTQKIFDGKDRSKKSKMVCVACLLPLFLIPIVNLLPVLFDIIMVEVDSNIYCFQARVYRILGWEYRKPERAPAACPYKPVANKTNESCRLSGEGQEGFLSLLPMLQESIITLRLLILLIRHCQQTLTGNLIEVDFFLNGIYLKFLCIPEIS